CPDRHTVDAIFKTTPTPVTSSSRDLIMWRCSEGLPPDGRQDGVDEVEESRHVREHLRSQRGHKTHGGGPAALVVVTSTGEHHHPDEGHDEAEDGHEHDPALRVRRHHQSTGHQDPNQTPEDLQGDRGPSSPNLI
ncbi:hypothetical protein INR49_018371, partial [Caranx melampygus]